VEVLPREGNAKLRKIAVKIEGSADASEARPWASLSFPKKTVQNQLVTVGTKAL